MFYDNKKIKYKWKKKLVLENKMKDLIDKIQGWIVDFDKLFY